MKFSLLWITVLICRVSIAQSNQFASGVQWDVKQNELVLKNRVEDNTGQKYWAYLLNLLPPEPLEKYITSLRLFTDGEQEDLGGMSPLNDQNTAWEVDLDTIDFNLNSTDSIYILDFIHTAIHEFGHLVTLNPEQVLVTDDEYQNDSIGYLTSEGYAIDGSYLGEFVKQFWNDGLLENWDKIDKIRVEPIRLNKLYKFYLDNEENFMTDYAAESPEEDIAESWTFFVLCDKPSKNLVKYEKVRFFYQYPKLLEYRNQIRANLNAIPDNYLEKNKWVLDNW